MRLSFPTRILVSLLPLAFSIGFLGQTGSPSAPVSGPGQAATGENAPSNATEVRGRLLLVLPFENHTGQPNLAWIADAVPDILNRRLASAGFMPISRDDRLYALDHLGLPQSFQPSRASAIRLAQTLDADDVIVGSYAVNGSRLEASAQILSVEALHMSPPLTEDANIKDLLSVLDSLAWRLAKQLDPQFAVAQNTFVAADSKLRVDVFENYIRGLVETDPAEQIRHLKQAVSVDPGFSPALLALGKAYFANQQYEEAATTLGRLPKDDARAREADFYRGLAYLYIGSYSKAEDAFAFVSRQLPLPEVVNNQGVAASRRGRDAASLFQQAVAADPNDPDYQFNLSIALWRKRDYAGAMHAVEQTLKLRPQDTEAQALQAKLRDEAQHPPAAEKTAASNLPSSDPATENGPLERVKRTFNEASFRQAAFEMEQVEEMRLASLPPDKHAAALADEGMRFLNQGLILEAEREFQAALQVDPKNSVSHAGLAVIRERDGESDAARREAQTSLQLQPNAAAYLVLARLDLQANEMPAAADNLSNALKLEPQNAAARGLRQQLQTKEQQLP